MAVTFKYKGREKQYKKEYRKKYYKLHREKLLQDRKLLHQQNKDRDKIYYENYRRENREQIRKHNRILHREHVLPLNGKNIYGINKRSYTGYCELCGRVVGEEIKQLNYHHWDDKDVIKGNTVKGIWICYRCHHLCEAVDKDELQFIQRYLRLKRAINKEWKTKEKIKPELN